MLSPRTRRAPFLPASLPLSSIPTMPTIIPQELYRDIISHLHHDHDSGTRGLVSTAKCSCALRNEAQRILFRNPFMLLWKDSDKQNCKDFSILWSHETFLEAILRAPTRLGPLVRSYNQFQVSYNLQENGMLRRCLFACRSGPLIVN